MENNLFPLGCYCSAPSCCSCPGSRLAQPPPPAWLMGPGWKPGRPHPPPPPHAPLVTARFLPASAFQNQARRRGRGSLRALPGVLRGGEVGGMGPRCAPPHPESPALPSPPRSGTQQELSTSWSCGLVTLKPRGHVLARWLQVSSCRKTQLVPPQRGGTSLLQDRSSDPIPAAPVKELQHPQLSPSSAPALSAFLHAAAQGTQRWPAPSFCSGLQLGAGGISPGSSGCLGAQLND